MNFIVLAVVVVVCCTSFGSTANLPNDQKDVESRLMRLEERVQRAEDFETRITKLEELMTQTRNFVAELVTRLAKSENYEVPHIITKRQAVDEPLIEEAVNDELQSVINAHGVINVQIGQAGTPGAPGPSGEAGPPGLNGSPGSPGPIGLPGPAGEDGKNGTDGSDGSPGLRGPQGEDGPPGLAGEDGHNGTDGSDGQPGIPGSIGPIGQRGADGRDGVPGSNGRNGYPGSVGAAGSPGSCSTQGRCPSPYEIFLGKCIYIPRATLNWTSAREYCENQGAYLLTFSSKYMSEKFVEYLSSQGSTSGMWWIGGKKISGYYYWVGATTGKVPENNSPGSQWHPGHSGDPSDCLYYHVYSSEAGLNSHDGCHLLKTFVCEKVI